MRFPWSRLFDKIDRLEKHMADIQTGFNDLSAAITALTGEEASVVTAIQALQAQVAAGSPVTGDQLESLATQVSSVTSGLQAAIAPPATSPVATASAVKK